MRLLNFLMAMVLVLAIIRVILVMKDMQWNFLEAKMFLIQKFIYDTWIVILFASAYLVIHAVIGSIESVSIGPIFALKGIAEFFAILAFLIVITRWYTMLTCDMRMRYKKQKKKTEKTEKK